MILEINLTNLLTVEFILPTIIGIIGLTPLLKKRGKELSITLDKVIFIKDDYLSKFDDIEVLFKNVPVRKKLSLLRVSIINSSSMDFDLSNSEQNLTISFPEGTEVLKGNLLKASEKLNVSVITNNDNLEIEGGIFKKNEIFSIEVIVIFDDEFEFDETEKNQNKILHINHRIKDLEKVNQLIFDSDLRKKIKSNAVSLVTFGVLIIFELSGIVTSYRGLPPTMNSLELSYKHLNQNKVDSNIYVPFAYQKDTIELVGLNPRKTISIPINEFYCHTDFKPVITKKIKDPIVKFRIRNSFYSLFLLIILLISMSVQHNRDRILKRRVYKLLEE